MNLILFLNIIIIQICDIFKYKYSLNTCHLVNVRQNGGERCVHSGTMEARETTWVSRDFLIVFCTAGLRKARSVSSEEAAKEGAERTCAEARKGVGVGFLAARLVVLRTVAGGNRG